MYCPNCEFEIKQEVTECPVCGGTLSEHPEDSAAPETAGLDAEGMSGEIDRASSGPSLSDLIQGAKQELGDMPDEPDFDLKAEGPDAFYVDATKGPDEGVESMLRLDDEAPAADEDEAQAGAFDLEEALGVDEINDELPLQPAPDATLPPSGAADRATADAAPPPPEAPLDLPPPAEEEFSLEEALGLDEEERSILAGAGEPEPQEEVRTFVDDDNYGRASFDEQSEADAEAPSVLDSALASLSVPPAPEDAEAKDALDMQIPSGSAFEVTPHETPSGNSAEELSFAAARAAAPEQVPAASGPLTVLENSEERLEQLIERHDPGQKPPRRRSRLVSLVVMGAALIAGVYFVLNYFGAMPGGYPRPKQPAVPRMHESPTLPYTAETPARAPGASGAAPAGTVPLPSDQTASVPPGTHEKAPALPQQPGTGAGASLGAARPEGKADSAGAPKAPAQPESARPAQGAESDRSVSYTIHTDAFKDRAAAEKEIARLKELGFDAYLVKKEHVSSYVIETEEMPDKAQYSLHTYSFRKKQYALEEVARMQKLGFDAYILTVDLGELGVWHRVKIGRFQTRAEAERVQQELAQKDPHKSILMQKK